MKNLKEEVFTRSQYIKPKRYSYQGKDNKIYTWDFIEAMDSVSIFLYHIQDDAFLFVKQFRIPLWDYQKRNNINLDEMGYSIELCSGLVDKNLSLEQIAKEECIEEVGYSPKNIELIGEFYTGFGSGVSRQFLYFAQIDENDKVGYGGGIDGENIQILKVQRNAYEQFYKLNPTKSPLLEFAYLWFKNR
ncbi:nudix-type nucleoside diphosphatase [Campylobacter insulaenigrae]|uniref:Nudix-type nucleoside diphosphatase n=2 Tax=Campylobacter insulaenigrae TaxID=260714 RepID=A0A0A8H500_9BACT|nr:nudix-type nucleoside diphosphatase [Campylobacter insulaenigrae]AJC87959.1 nudix-type nucleoside diphosphatase [Campylobacter insulaenigrae NCTC 12927]MCR6570258.1 nudix-type nucleoside diphosphatase [Campylobacter insulaenigrae]MCR6571660.1 nudix-type nucleoside diphosphatase [Campylobacter insulaenigrae]MCR6573298.1 nudix-type nucleoside diphosphatase [Campylobacter insulaenigrae]MCR6574763.1 nudix-type nucleoside diphosphatase [Campylobacter insulaenigrae]